MIALAEIAAGPMTLGQIESAAAKYNIEASTLEEQIARLEADLDTVKQKHLRRIKKQAATVAAAQATLHHLVDSSPELFRRPRTFTLHGVKFGFSASEGKLEFDDEPTVIALIKKYLPDQEKILIRTTEEPNKDAIKILDANLIKKIGCRIDGAGDKVILTRTAGDVEKLMNKLIVKMVSTLIETEK